MNTFDWSNLFEGLKELEGVNLLEPVNEFDQKVISVFSRYY